MKTLAMSARGFKQFSKRSHCQFSIIDFLSKYDNSVKSLFYLSEFSCLYYSIQPPPRYFFINLSMASRVKQDFPLLM